MCHAVPLWCSNWHFVNKLLKFLGTSCSIMYYCFTVVSVTFSLWVSFCLQACESFACNLSVLITLWLSCTTASITLSLGALCIIINCQAAWLAIYTYLLYKTIIITLVTIVLISNSHYRESFVYVTYSSVCTFHTRWLNNVTYSNVTWYPWEVSQFVFLILTCMHAVCSLHLGK